MQGCLTVSILVLLFSVISSMDCLSLLTITRSTMLLELIPLLDPSTGLEHPRANQALDYQGPELILLAK